ncbi:hypothetical protein HDU77_003344 [Chytriomyces hyalinus]|nr:hypothetical protein HDU77_003344 [Chytriomyces hyalinus]
MAPFHQDLPSEVWQNIILRLPVDQELHKLYQTMPIVKGILSDIKFTTQHLQVYLSSVGVTEPEMLPILYSLALPDLPIAYKVAVFTQVVLKDIESPVAKGISKHRAVVPVFIRTLPANRDMNGKNPRMLLWACEVGQVTLLAHLLQPELRSTYRSSILDEGLMRAAKRGHVEVAVWLLGAGADPLGPAAGLKTLAAVAWGRHEAMVRLLLADPRTDASQDGSKAFMLAMEQCHFGVACRLLG